MGAASVAAPLYALLPLSGWSSTRFTALPGHSQDAPRALPGHSQDAASGSTRKLRYAAPQRADWVFVPQHGVTRLPVRCPSGSRGAAAVAAAATTEANLLVVVARQVAVPRQVLEPSQNVGCAAGGSACTATPIVLFGCSATPCGTVACPRTVSFVHIAALQDALPCDTDPRSSKRVREGERERGQTHFPSCERPASLVVQGLGVISYRRTLQGYTPCRCSRRVSREDSREEEAPPPPKKLA